MIEKDNDNKHTNICFLKINHDNLEKKLPFQNEKNNVVKFLVK